MFRPTLQIFLSVLLLGANSVIKAQCDTIILKESLTRTTRRVVICPNLKIIDSLQFYRNNYLEKEKKVIFSISVNKKSETEIVKITLVIGQHKHDISYLSVFFKITFIDNYPVPLGRETEKIGFVVKIK